MLETTNGLMKLNQITAKMYVKIISLHGKKIRRFCFRNFEKWIFCVNHYNVTEMFGNYRFFSKIFKTILAIQKVRYGPKKIP